MLRSGCRKSLRYKIKCLNNSVAIQAWIHPRLKKLSRVHWYAKAVRLAKNNQRWKQSMNNKTFIMSLILALDYIKRKDWALSTTCISDSLRLKKVMRKGPSATFQSKRVLHRPSESTRRMMLQKGFIIKIIRRGHWNDKNWKRSIMMSSKRNIRSNQTRIGINKLREGTWRRVL